MHTIVLRSDSIRRDNPLHETLRMLFPQCRIIIMNNQDASFQRDMSTTRQRRHRFRKPEKISDGIAFPSERQAD
ncbi:MAG: hypothetical protein ABIL58_08515 [Pseudomonadota bacterium]